MSIKKQLGFSMLEVLISMLVIMIGVLGIAGMQMLAVNNSENARYEGQAAILVSSLAAEMQANPGYWASTTLPTPTASISVTGTTIGTVPAYASTCLATTCSPVQMAYYDLYNFGAAITGVANADGQTYNGTALPASSGTVLCNLPVATVGAVPGTPGICTITLTWYETNTALSNATTTETGQLATGKPTAHTYQTLVSIQP